MRARASGLADRADVAKAAKKAHKEGLTLKESVLALNLMSSDDFDAKVRRQRSIGSDGAGSPGNDDRAR